MTGSPLAGVHQAEALVIDGLSSSSPARLPRVAWLAARLPATACTLSLRRLRCLASAAPSIRPAAPEQRAGAVAADGPEVGVAPRRSRQRRIPATASPAAWLAAAARCVPRRLAFEARDSARVARPCTAGSAGPVTRLPFIAPVSACWNCRSSPAVATVHGCRRCAAALAQDEALQPVEPGLPVDIACAAARLRHGAAGQALGALRGMVGLQQPRSGAEAEQDSGLRPPPPRPTMPRGLTVPLRRLAGAAPGHECTAARHVSRALQSANAWTSGGPRKAAALMGSSARGPRAETMTER